MTMSWSVLIFGHGQPIAKITCEHTVINHHRCFMHIKHNLALCQNRAFMPNFRLLVCLLSYAQCEMFKFSKMTTMATGQPFDFWFCFYYGSKTIGDCRNQIAGVCLQESDCRSQIAEVGLQESEYRSWISQVGLQELDCRSQIAGVGFQELDCSEISPILISLHSFFCLVFY